MCIRDRPNVERLRQSGPFTSKDQFINSSLNDFKSLLRMTSITPGHNVLDYGCGLGRLCVPLRPYLSDGGSYVGIDTDRAATEYLNDLHPDQDFAFHHVDIFSQMYNREGQPIKKALRKAKLDNKVDLAFLFSVFTHVLPDDVAPLLKFLAKNVKKGGQIFATFFILNDASKHGIAAVSYTHLTLPTICSV